MIHAPIYPQGTRVRVKRGRFPMDVDLIGRAGLVAEVDEYRPQRYGVVLDGDDTLRDFAEDELESLDEAGDSEEPDGTEPAADS